MATKKKPVRKATSKARRKPVAKPKRKAAARYVYSFGGGRADGSAKMKNTLGGKGAGLAEMAGLGIPVPAGFTITTEVCTYFSTHDRKYPKDLPKQVDSAMAKVEQIMGAKFGDVENPLLVSVRSGARQSMPGMMETVLNVGLTSATIPGLIKKSGKEWFVWDAYRRLIMMYSDVVMEKAEGIEAVNERGIRVQLEEIMDELKHSRHRKSDTDLTRQGPEGVVRQLQEVRQEGPGQRVPRRPVGAALGRYRRRVRLVGRQARYLVPSHRGHSP